MSKGGGEILLPTSEEIMGQVIENEDSITVKFPTEQRAITIQKPKPTLVHQPKPDPTFQWIAFIVVPLVVAVLGIWGGRRKK
jgi:hypothetical protein